MNELLHFLQRFSYTNSASATFQILNNYITQIEKIASSLKDPYISKVVRTLRTVPINKIGYQLSALERYLYIQITNQEQKTDAKKTSSKQPKANKPKFKIYKNYSE
jgi:hypothetical protein